MNEHDTPQQLTLLREAEVPLQFRLDEDTRRRGMQHIAEIRRLLAERRATGEHLLPTRPTRPTPHRSTPHRAAAERPSPQRAA